MIILLFVGCVVLSTLAQEERILVLNALGWNNETALHSLETVLETAETLHRVHPEEWRSLSRRALFIHEGAISQVNSTELSRIQNDLGIEVNVLKSSPWPNLRRGESNPKVEHISAILEGLNRCIVGIPSKGRVLVSVSSTAKSLAVPLPAFFDLFKAVRAPHPYTVALPAKNSRFTTPSDWHDLQVIAVRLDAGGLTWLSDLQSVLKSYATRASWTMLEPRPAIMEASMRLGLDQVFYMDGWRLCFSGYKLKSDEVFPKLAVSQKQSDLSCPHYTDTGGEGVKDGGTASGGHYVHLLYDAVDGSLGRPVEGLDWKEHIATTETGDRRYRLAQKLGLHRSRWETDLPHAMREGSLRFRLASSRDSPKEYCWHHDDSGPMHNKRHRRFSFWGKGGDDDEDEDKAKAQKSNTTTIKGVASLDRILLVTGVYGHASSIDQYMFSHISKMYYARRHGHSFMLQISNRLAAYLPQRLFGSVGISRDKMLRFRNTLAKIVMVLDAMYTHPDVEWLFFSDSDVDFNTHFLGIPHTLYSYLCPKPNPCPNHNPIDIDLRAYVADVPSDKVFILPNLGSELTAVFFARNTPAGRALLRDWLAVAMSGFVSCSAYDRSALQVLFLLRQLPQEKWSHTPAGFDCLSSEVEVHALGRHGTGCSKAANGHEVKGGITGDNTCDVAFERKLRQLGFLTALSAKAAGAVNNTFSRSVFVSDMAPSSIVRGCANDVVRDFHVTKETKLRPRLLCTFCGKAGEVLSNAASTGGFGLGGGNDLLHAGAVDGWLLNHKAQWLFHEEWLDNNGCPSVPNFPPPCGDVVIGDDRKGSVKGTSGGRDYVDDDDNADSIDRKEAKDTNVSFVPDAPALPVPVNLTSARDGSTGVPLGIREEDTWPQFFPLWGHPSRAELSDMRKNRKDSSESAAALGAVRQLESEDVVGPLDSVRTRLLSLVDGLALDVDKGTFCTVGSPGVRRHQRTFTYMNEYRQVLAISRRLSDEEWGARYRARGGGESRSGARCKISDVGKKGNELEFGVDDIWPRHLQLHAREDYVCQADGFLWRTKEAVDDKSTNNWYRTQGASRGLDACAACVKREVANITAMDCSGRAQEAAVPKVVPVSNSG